MAALLVIWLGSPVRGQFAPTLNVSSVIMNGPFACSTSAGSGAFPVASWSWGETLPATAGTNGEGAGKVSFSDLSVVRTFDACSAALAQLGASGSHVSRITLKEFNKSNELVESVVLTDAVIESYQSSGSSALSSPSESLQFAFGTVTIDYFTSGGEITFCWNVTTAQKC